MVWHRSCLWRQNSRTSFWNGKLFHRYYVYSLKLLITAWFIFTIIMTIATLRSSVTLFGTFINLSATFLLLAIGNYRYNDVNFVKAAGYFGLLAAFCGWYNAICLIWNRDNSWISLPIGIFPWAKMDRRRDYIYHRLN